jgi:hypothetical protein
VPKRVPGQTHSRALSASKVEDLWTTRLAIAYCQQIPFSLIVVALSAMQNSSHLVTTVRLQQLENSPTARVNECCTEPDAKGLCF